jgi:hypothetical protein
MKLRRLYVALVAIAAPCAVNACGGDDSSGGGGGDAGADAFPDCSCGADVQNDGPLPDAGAVNVAVADQNVYAGQEASLMAVATTHTGSFTFAWTLVSAPTGSTVTTASLGMTNAPDVKLVPDIVGDYVVQVVVNETGYSPSTTMATVHAFAAPVFFARAIMDANGGEVGVHVSGHDKSNEHAVACAINFGPPDESTYRTRTLFAAATTMDAWEAPAGMPSRFIFSGTSSLTQDAGNYATILIAGTTQNSCNTVPTTLRSIQAQAGALGQPRFSPDGTRIAFLDPVGASFGVSTIGFDATGYRAIAPIYASPPGSGDESANIRPEWQDATHVAWPRPTGSGTWSVMVANDAAAATPTTYMTCTGSTPHHIALLADGSIVASYSPTANTPSDLFVLKPDATTKACTVVHQLTTLGGTSASRAHDFAVSPDQKSVAYLHYDATAHGGAASSGNDGDLYLVPVDASAVAKAVGATPVSGRIGPRWIGGGSRLAWTRAGQAADGGDPRSADNVNVVMPDGGGALDIIAGDGVSTIVGAVGPGGSCAIGRGDARASILGIFVAALALLRRRRGARGQRD